MEVLRLIEHLAPLGVQVTVGVLSMVRNDYGTEDADRLKSFLVGTKSKAGISFSKRGFIQDYPDTSIFDRPNAFENCPKIKSAGKSVLVLSPGGGSGKFGVCLSQLFHDFVAGINSSYMKFETFPVFNLRENHPLNLAFMAATADLGNTIVKEGKGLTAYDKDMQNMALLKVLFERHCPEPSSNLIASYDEPSDMSVNKITAGFLDEEGIQRAAVEEIARRRERYTDEVTRAIETEGTLRHLEENLPQELRLIRESDNRD